MVKLFDGSLVTAGELLDGSGQDEEGKQLKFKQVGTTWTAESHIPADPKHKRVYSFALADTMVKVSLILADKGKEGEEPEEKENEKIKAESIDKPERITKPNEVKTEKTYKTSSPADYKKKYY